MSDSRTYDIVLVSGAILPIDHALCREEAQKLANNHNDGVVSGTMLLSDAALVMCEGALLHGPGNHPDFQG